MHNSHFTPGRDHRGGWEEGLQEMRRGMVGQWWKKGIPARGIDSTPPSMFTALLRIPANVKEEQTRGEGDGRGTCNVAPLCIQERLIYKHSCSLSWLHNESNKPGCTEQFPKKKKKKKKVNYYSGFANPSIQHWFATSKKKRQTSKAWTALMLQSWRLKLQFHRASWWILKAVQVNRQLHTLIITGPRWPRRRLDSCRWWLLWRSSQRGRTDSKSISHSTAKVCVALPEFDSRPLRITFIL